MAGAKPPRTPGRRLVEQRRQPGFPIRTASWVNTMPLIRNISARSRRLNSGSFAQRYVKRHVLVRERAETRRLRWFLSPFPRAISRRFLRSDRRPESGTFRRTRRTSGQVDVFPKPWNWEQRIRTSCLRETQRIMFLNCVLKPVFRSHPERGFQERMRSSAVRWSQGCDVRHPGSVQGHRNYLAEMPSVTTSGSGGCRCSP